MPDSAINNYLTDHMAGSLSASDLARRGAKNNAGAVAQFFGDLSREIEIDRRTLEQIAIRVDAQASPLKQAAAIAAERLSRFKIDHRMSGSGELSLLLELELLYLGIQGKHTLWRTLEVLADPRLAEFDFGKLQGRADEQLAAVEERRLAIVRSALAE
jgi:broad specificity phosphatase PhoE